MTKEKIIQMAREAGGYLAELPKGDAWLFAEDEYLERFAALVASAEREQCKKLCTWKTGNQFVDEAVAVCYRAIDQRGQA